MKDRFKKFKYAGVAIIVAAILGIVGGEGDNKSDVTKKIAETTEAATVNNNQVLAENNGKPYVVIDNKPSFSKKEITKKSYETYSELDSYGRCGVAMACVGKDIMPTEERGAIGQVKPSGWHTIKYDCVDGKYLYNRCHLIGYQLTGENANEKNLITGTRYLNVDGMLSFENMVADYVKETNNHVMYRVTPIYEGDNLLASGVEMEAYSVEDNGEGISFHVYCYNVQPGVKIDYKNGDSSLDDNVDKSNTSKKNNDNDKSTKKNDNKTTKNNDNNNKTTKKHNSTNKNTTKAENNIVDDEKQNTTTEYVLNMNTNKFHYPSCYSVKRMSNANKGTYKGDRQDLIDHGYEPCKNCNP